MEKVLYRIPLERDIAPGSASATAPGASASAPAARPLEPELFYPSMSDQELGVWEHWLPTTHVFQRSSGRFPQEVAHTLKMLKAPPEVVEEFAWCRNMELFQAYEIRTPTRRDLRDPLLIGCHDGKRYRIALWGESLRPFEEISALVERSLALRDRTVKWNIWLIIVGALVGGSLGWWLGSQETFEGSRVGTSIFLAMLGFCGSWLATWVQTPENRQQNFLDRYRR